MRAVTIDLARGADQSVDPRVAPQGTIARAQDVRIDKFGRLVARRGYTSLGVTVQGNGTGLVPFDLHHLDGDLVCLGNNSSANQSGIRAPYLYEGDVSGTRGVWRTEHASAGAADNSAAFIALPAADSVRVLASEVFSGQTDEVVADVAATSNGTYTCTVSTGTRSFVLSVQVTVHERTTGRVIYSELLPACSNPRVLAISNVFYVFTQDTTNIRVSTFNPASSTAMSGTTTVATATTAAPGPYDIAPFESSTDYLIAFATPTGYTWRRFNSANVQQTTTSTVSLANAPVSICGASGETVNVINVRAATGAEIRTYTTAGALSVGPTNLDTLARVYLWVGICRMSSTQVFCTFFGTAPDARAQGIVVTTAAHVATASVQHFTRPVTKPAFVDGHVFIWESLGQGTQRVYGLTSWGSAAAANESFLSALAFDGAAKTSFSAATVFYCPQLTRGGSTRWYAGLVTFDPRDKTFRSNALEFELFSGKRRQGVASGGNLYLAGGVTTIYDRRVAGGLGFETTPKIVSTSQNVGGSLTLLGVYQLQLVYRFVWSSQDTMQSAPSDVVTVTMAGASQTILVTLSTPYTSLLSQVAIGSGATVFLDVYRTEAGGSIPRLSQSIDLGAPGGSYGPAAFVFSETNADSVVQAGAALYTQGADGSVSGRLPLSFGAPCQLIAESDARLLLGRLERDTQLHLSVENRPGESLGFVNDDLFYVQNPERLEAICAGDGGRRYLFGRQNIRELVGPGPNSAGVGDISEPVEIESRVGCTDWRSVVKTEHGVFFQTSARGKPRIYLLPSSGGGAIDASAGVADLLELYPVITSATRHDEEQLLTFTLQTSAGTDGRILHLDLKTSGMGKSGWTGRWLVDRVQAFEGAPSIEIVEETIQVLPFVAPGVVSIPLPLGKRSGDRLIVAIAAQVATTTLTTPTSYTLLSNLDSSAGTVYVFERILTTTAGYTAVSLSTTLGVNSTALVVKTWLLRGAHGSQATELTSVISASGTTHALPTLTPTWGSANTLWLSLAMSDIAFAITQGIQIPAWRFPPSNFEHYEFAATSEVVAASSVDLASASRQLTGVSLSGASWTSATSTSAVAYLLGVRPLATAGTPVRASTHFRGRLVLCNATDVQQSDPDATGDAGTLFVNPELELGDIYPMGAGGEGRHLSICLLVEILGQCLVTALCSYDGGQNWKELRTHYLDGSQGYHVGQTVRLQWTPPRRKIQGVRVKFTVSEDLQLGSLGPTGGVAILQAQLFFEDLVGPSRVSATNRGGLGS